MGIYSSNRTGLNYYSGEEIVADESYVGTLGCYNALIDMERNNRAIFEAGLARDFQEAVMVNEGASDEEILAFTEASVSGLLSSFKAMVKKIWEKIKGVFNTFLKKLDTVIIRDNKKFVEKYQRQVRTKNLSKLKYKYCAEQAGFKDIKDALVDGAGLRDLADEYLDILETSNSGKVAELKNQLDSGDLESYIITSCISSDLKNVEMKDLAKEIHELCFDSESQEEGLDSARLTNIIIILQGDKTKKDVTDAQKTTDKHFSGVMKKLDAYSKRLSKTKVSGEGNNKKASVKGPGGEDDKEFTSDEAITTEISNVGLSQNAVSVLENVHNRAVACFLNENKFRISQARRVFAKAVSFNDKAKNESTYLDAVEEAAEYEITEMFENYEF